MANTIEMAKAYVPMLDTLYKQGSKTATLDVAPALVKAGNTAGSFLLPQMTLTGLGDYSRAAGYAKGEVDFSWVEYAYTQDRGRRFTVDAVDDIETAGQMFGALSAEFIRLHVIPEIDAYRLAKLAAGAGSGTEGILVTADDVIEALNAAHVELLEAEVDAERMALFISPTMLALAKNAPDSAAKCPVLNEVEVVSVPQSRLVTGIETDAGAETDEGGWGKALDAEDVNFILLDKGAVFSDAKHDVPRVFDPTTYQDANAWAFDYRIYHDMFILDNKATGVFAHVASAS
jgi:hypothetical protein